MVLVNVRVAYWPCRMVSGIVSLNGRAVDHPVDDGQLTDRATNITHRLVAREVELLGQGVQRPKCYACHRVHELLEPGGIAVKLLEHVLAAVLDLVLWRAGLQRLGQVAPEPVEPGVDHLEEAADVGRTLVIEESSRLGAVAIAARSPIAVPFENPQCDQRVEEVMDRARMETHPCAEFLTCHRAAAEVTEEVELDCGQQGLGRPETHADVQDAGRIHLSVRH